MTDNSLCRLLDPSIERHVFLSPHFDDVPFSVGGTVAMLSAHGLRPLTLVMAAQAPEPDDSLTEFATSHHTMWGIDGDAAGSMSGRLEEEQNAATILGMDVALLPFQDAIYRGNRYQGNDRLFGAIAEDEQSLPEYIVRAAHGAMSDTNEAVRWYCPLAVGRHVDHQLVYQASVTIARPGDEIWYFADQPYSLDLRLFSQRVEEIELPENLVHINTKPVWNQRIDAVMAYRSQIASAFGYVGTGEDRTEISQALGSRWTPPATTEMIERFWTPGAHGQGHYPAPMASSCQ